MTTVKAADLPLGTIIARGPEVLVKLKDDWHEAMSSTTRTFPDSDADWCLNNGWLVVRHGLGEGR